ncbi:NAD(P)H-binding protein [Corynebacterium sp. A21]|uniref:NAD(P)H-binding protein n=1 Tax=Corynebacterium sp. A21 TaxID=3457318 RepID=UPI003FD1A406
MTHSALKKKVLIIGGHGKIAVLAAPKLVAAGHAVTSLIRNPNQSADIEALGATPLVADVTTLSPAQWDVLQAPFDVVIWSAGNGGKAGPEVTIAVDRDAASASVDSAVRLGESAGKKAPRYLMVSFVGSRSIEFPGDSMSVYGAAKKAVDEQLLATEGLDYLILGPCILSEDPARGAEVIDDNPSTPSEDYTSRELVADVLVEMAGREQLPKKKLLAFRDGDTAVSQL